MISIICPVFNEASLISKFCKALADVLLPNAINYEILFINDGSNDDTLEKIRCNQKKYTNIRVINFSRNFGKEIALTAGLDYAKGNAVIPMDVDLQDPPELILELVARWQQGFKVVLAKRADRSSDNFIKRITANIYYKLHHAISDTHTPSNVGDFRLMDREVVSAIQTMPERQRYMKGMFSWVGFSTSIVEYKRNQRIDGQTKFNYWKLWNLALEGITSFSSAPLRVWLYIGSFISFIAFIYGSFIILRTLIYGIDVPGYASLLTIMLFMGGVQLIGTGVLGEYIGRIYIETKQRPLYIVESEE